MGTCSGHCLHCRLALKMITRYKLSSHSLSHFAAHQVGSWSETGVLEINPEKSSSFLRMLSFDLAV